jgi:hypothetical protein
MFFSCIFLYFFKNFYFYFKFATALGGDGVRNTPQWEERRRQTQGLARSPKPTPTDNRGLQQLLTAK